MEYYRLAQAFPDSGRWYLSGVFSDRGQEIDTSVFFQGSVIDLSSTLYLPIIGSQNPAAVELPLAIELRRQGPSLDFTLGAFDLPVARRALAQAIEEVAGDDVQRLASRIKGCELDFDILNITRTVACLDVDRSGIEWLPRMNADGSVLNEMFAVYDIAINPSLTFGRHIFRLSSWEIAIIVSSHIKEIMETFGPLGVNFIQVTK